MPFLSGNNGENAKCELFSSFSAENENNVAFGSSHELCIVFAGLRSAYLEGPQNTMLSKWNSVRQFSPSSVGGRETVPMCYQQGHAKRDCRCLASDWHHRHNGCNSRECLYHHQKGAPIAQTRVIQTRKLKK